MKWGISIGMVFWMACSRPDPIFPIEPRIEFRAMYPDSVKEPIDFTQLTEENRLYITLYFQDGDGDLGSSEPDSGDANFFLIDTRPNANPETLFYTLPDLSSDALKPSIQGEITVEVAGLLRTDPFVPAETTSFFIYIKDRAGNRSNVVRTPTITILAP